MKILALFLGYVAGKWVFIELEERARVRRYKKAVAAHLIRNSKDIEEDFRKIYEAL